MTTAAALTSEAEILCIALGELNKRLPTAWDARTQRAITPGRFRGDAVVILTGPRNQQGRLYAEVRRSLVTKDLDPLVAGINLAIAETAPSSNSTLPRPLVVARYLAPPLRAWLTERNVPYADATGNVRISLDEPALFLRDVGAQKDPWRGPGRPRGNLTGPSAARIVRALADYEPPYTVPQLMKLAGTPSGNTYRAVEFIEEQGFLTRSADGRVQEVQWRALLERWSQDFGFAKSGAAATFLAPRGLPDLMQRLAKLKSTKTTGRYAVTASLATPKWEAYAPAKNAMIYAERVQDIVDALNLRAVDAGANVLITSARADAVFERTQELDGVTIVAPSQAVVDLLTAPGRGAEQARALLDWMEKNESAWRR